MTKTVILLICLIAVGFAAEPYRRIECPEGCPKTCGNDVKFAVCGFNGWTRTSYESYCDACNADGTTSYVVGKCEDIPEGVQYCAWDKKERETNCPVGQAQDQVCGKYQRDCLGLVCQGDYSSTCVACLDYDVDYTLPGNCEWGGGVDNPTEEEPVTEPEEPEPEQPEEPHKPHKPHHGDHDWRKTFCEAHEEYPTGSDDGEHVSTCTADFQHFSEGFATNHYRRRWCHERSEACIEIYDPVCGFNDNGDRITYGNSCMACQDTNVYSWVPEKCADIPTDVYYCPKERPDPAVTTCTADYTPVCGQLNYNCYGYFCQRTQPNACNACLDPHVDYFHQGQCSWDFEHPGQVVYNWFHDHGYGDKEFKECQWDVLNFFREQRHAWADKFCKADGEGVWWDGEDDVYCNHDSWDGEWLDDFEDWCGEEGEGIDEGEGQEGEGAGEGEGVDEGEGTEGEGVDEGEGQEGEGTDNGEGEGLDDGDNDNEWIWDDWVDGSMDWYFRKWKKPFRPICKNCPPQEPDGNEVPTEDEGEGEEGEGEDYCPPDGEGEGSEEPGDDQGEGEDDCPPHHEDSGSHHDHDGQDHDSNYEGSDHEDKRRRLEEDDEGTFLGLNLNGSELLAFKIGLEVLLFLAFLAML